MVRRTYETSENTAIHRAAFCKSAQYGSPSLQFAHSLTGQIDSAWDSSLVMNFETIRIADLLRCFPTILRSPGLSSHFYLALQTLELLSNIYSIAVFSLSVGHILKLFQQSKIFHPNFISPLLCFYAQTYMFTFTRFILSMFQNGFIDLGDSTSRSYHILIFLSELRFYELFIAVYTFVSLTIERVCATLFIRNYEINTRRYISAGLILYSVISLTNERWISMLSLLKQVSVVSALTASSMCIDMYFIIAYHESRNLSSILGAVFDTLQASSYCFLLSLVVFSQSSWRDSFANKIGLAKWPWHASGNLGVQPTNYEATSDAYFNQLGQSWDGKFEFHNAKLNKML
ncbi:hypothetical protein PRIPAC_79535 [Pristionchus pacificus]|uniref:G protein-coupled receptor n=1 Tax=Pristionchus pacificus TaxID=54126 RepID=A0A2A6CL85_PRIPA|nr:hypothetical protein PRIPAC_79535 [Pristionchus pacificus]|eukprot:PDM78879.1 G protein-coupled receptor [Pristionchus pacificus]